MTTATKHVRGIIGLKELRENMGTYIKHAGEGRSFTVVRRSRPIFKLVPADEWGDEGTWETVLDFRKEGGMPIEKFIDAVKRFDAKNK